MRGKAPCDPVDQRPLSLLGKFQFTALVANGTDQLQSAVRLILDILNEADRAIVRQFGNDRQDLLRLLKLVQVDVT